MSPEKFMGSNQRYRTSNQRRVILEEIKKVNTHPTADEVYEIVRRRLPRISLGTVYRNLEVLSTCGLIQKIGPISNQMRFDGNTSNHYHIRCVYCGRVEDAPIETVEEIENRIREETDYTIIGHTLEFVGVCPECGKHENGLRERQETSVMREQGKRLV
jgi:Fur family ferric uptake transcriptional regulator